MGPDRRPIPELLMDAIDLSNLVIVRFAPLSATAIGMANTGKQER
jgi:hypothetical protein